MVHDPTEDHENRPITEERFEPEVWTDRDYFADYRHPVCGQSPFVIDDRHFWLNRA